MSILQLLAQGNFITFNKIVAKELGVNSAILLGALCGYQTSFGEGNEFFKEQPKICDDTCLGIYELKQATKILKENGLIKVSKKGCPAKNYYLVSANKLGDFLLTRELKNNQQDSENSTNYINNNTNTNISSINKEEKKVIKKGFVPPTYEQVLEYAKSRGREDLVKKYYDYFTTGNWVDSQGKKVKNWKQKFITWENNNPIKQATKPTSKKWGSADYYDSDDDEVF